jgi:chaperonin cofactor prefoldin
MTRPDSTDRKKLIRDLAHMISLLEEKVKTLEKQVRILKRKLGENTDANK